MRSSQNQLGDGDVYVCMHVLQYDHGVSFFLSLSLSLSVSAYRKALRSFVMNQIRLFSGLRHSWNECVLLKMKLRRGCL